MNIEENINGINELNLDEMEEVSGGKSAGQKIKATGNVHVRKTPSLNGAELGIMGKGDTVKFLGELKFDNRGVAWYKVRYNAQVGWVSSKYAKIA